MATPRNKYLVSWGCIVYIMKFMRTNLTIQGFSLVELSIVLVIVGLLVGGVLAGQSLIRAAELRSITRDLDRFQTSVYAFRDKYFELPGDITNATSFWGLAGGTTGDSTDGTCQAVTSTGPATCNGNGDGLIVGSSMVFEQFRAWQHLANAGLIEGQYTGRNITTGWTSMPGTNVPRGRITNSGYSIMWRSEAASGTVIFLNGDYNGSFLVFP